ncbi:substrate-binding domain-containing protein, partial [Salinicola peritrichatus]|uniref:substrate-binding domain-containing protein n=1 Tax=Salinicola peritrichatus TaxID=1267424 RepID=UPI0013A682BB
MLIVIWRDQSTGYAILPTSSHTPDVTIALKVLSIPGPAGGEWAHLREEGLKEAVADCPGLNLVEGPVGGAVSISYGLSQASDLLQRNPDAKFIFTPQVSLGMGAAQAVKQRHLDVGVVTSTLVKKSFPLLEDGSLLANSTEPSILMGRLIVQYTIRKAEGLPMPNLQQTKSAPYPTLIVKWTP